MHILSLFKFRYLLLVLFTSFTTLQSFSQVITIKGKVIDSKTRNAIPGASVRIGNYSTSTDEAGKFVLLVQKAIAENQPLRFSFIGYKALDIKFQDTEINVALIPKEMALNEVVIASPRESILNRAIRKIPENYNYNSFSITGNLRIVNSAKIDSTDTYYYNSDATLRLYYPPHKKQASPNTQLINKEDTLVKDPKYPLSVRWLSGYTSFAKTDYVREKPEFLNRSTKKYNYIVNGTELINNHRVYVVNFFATDKTGNAGTLYIDTVSYAFVRITSTRYNIKNGVSIDIDKGSNSIDYKIERGKWYLDEVENNIIARYKGQDLFKTSKFKSDSIQLTALKSIPYQNILPSNMEDINVSKGKETDLSKDLIPIRNPFAVIEAPKIDTVPPAKTTFIGKLKLLEGFRNYVFRDNIRVKYGLANLPVRVDGNQAPLGKDLSQTNNYAFYINTQFRLLQKYQLFLQYENSFNFGITELRNSTDSYGLSYYLKLNNVGHPLALSPAFGISTLDLSHKKIVYYSQSSLYYALSFSYETSPRRQWFINCRYDDIYKVKNNGLNIRQQPITIAVGFVMKLKT
jgi:hypothetical protein